MRGIDISNWQGGLDLNKLDIDFAIMKATEGVSFVDKYCDPWVQQCIANGIKWGFYHFARNNEPETEANHFYYNCENYFTNGIPVLDIEDEAIPDWGEYAQRFVDRIHALSGVYPVIYASASTLYRFSDTQVPSTCGLWVAGYPRAYTGFVDVEMPYDISPWSLCAMWQFTSSGRLNGYNGNLDLNYAFMDESAWDRYANPESTQPLPQPEPNKPIIVEDDSYKITVEKK
jgi:GH25 family lysozyme M1 (1,4-beta-N-acetylmuramidase)